MKANELIEEQHRLVEDLFEQFESAKGAAKTRIFERIAGNLVAHDAIEREIFYPACEEALEDEDILGESLVEHGVVEFCIFRADKNQGQDEFDKYVTVLKEVVMHHVKEEEKELLPKAKRALGKERLEELGEAMEARFQEALKEDFRVPLRAALEQVLSGKTKTTPPKRNGSRAPSSRSTSRASGSRASTGGAQKRRGAAEQPRVRHRRRK
jgi:hemerythrin superfamily protein